MPNEDKRRRLDGATTAQLSVAELIARREAETQEIPVITDAVIADVEVDTSEPTIRFTAVAPKPHKATSGGRELHIAELLRREGRAEDAAETGGFAMGKLVAAASGGVVLCGTVAFGASSWLSSPDERPLAEVRFDERVQARGSSDNGVVKIPTKTQDQQVPGTESADQTQEAQPQQAQPRVAPYTQQTPGTQVPTQTQAPQQTSTETPTSTTTPPSSETPTPPSSTTPPPPESSSNTPPPSSSPPSKKPVKVDLGILDPILGEFDFFAPAS